MEGVVGSEVRAENRGGGAGGGGRDGELVGTPSVRSLENSPHERRMQLLMPYVLSPLK